MVRLIVVMALLQVTNLNALSLIPFPSCLTIKGIVREVKNNTATIIVNKEARSEMIITLTFQDWEKVMLLPSTPIEAKAVVAKDKDTFIVQRKNVSIAKNFNPLFESVKRDLRCEK